MKIGLFGGAFDPVHNAHLFVAEAVRAAERLDRVVFLPLRAGHHRNALRGSVEDRATMLRLAIASNPAFALDLTDTDEEATGYTADLLPRMRALYPDDELYFIAGSDSIVRGGWQRIDDVFAQLDGFLIVPRPEIERSELDVALAALPPQLRAKIHFIDLPLHMDSATTVRDRLEALETVRYLVPEAVWRYITERGLYTNGVAQK
ncbi:MAG TPA: nicotinate (nicotinamide) nucleotide adenylyltransferase [Candidatus Baltobacteraceae bacterium]|jgi:nicotinate-nucleotide adenylyltransferase